MRTRYLYLLRLILVLSDMLLVNACYLLAFYFVDHFKLELSDELYQHFLIVYNLCWLVSSSLFTLYRSSTVRRLESIYRSTWKSLLAHGFLLGCYLIFTKNTLYSRQFLFFLYSTLCAAFLVSRFIITVIDLRYRRSFHTRRSVAVLGFNATGIKLAQYFQSHPNDFRFEGILDEDKALFVDEKGKLNDRMREGIRLAATKDIKEIYAAIPPHLLSEARPLLREAERQCVRLRLVPDLSSAMASRFRVAYMDEFAVLSLRPEPLENINNRVKKRMFDVVFSIMVVVFLLSWLFPILAIIIKAQSPGPVLFKQLRSGRDNKSFYCYKFRSMKVNRDSDTRQASKDDDRITPIGKFLRRSSMDELPQFFNVIMGEMSVVGPRPHMLKHTEQYRAIIDQFMVRHFLKPGITGWAQVTGLRGETKDPALMAKRVERDIWYLERWSLMLDIRIIFMTVYATLKNNDKAF
ncbi:MAG: undecaprenyl-phosphate glucose phosphotransferase [Bacteroidota bacterium]